MDLIQRINQKAAVSIATQVQVAEELSEEIAATSERLVECLLQDGKFLICGNGVSASIAQAFTSHLLNHFEHERPPLPALCLCSSHSTTTAIATDSGFSEIYSKQIHALGTKNDVLIAICSDGNSPNTVQAVQAAHERDLNIIALTAGQGGDVARLLGPEDIEIRVPSEARSDIHLSHLLIVHCLLDLLDSQLFGIE
ncbi:MAG: SIS domain-containing protein [Pseudomonadales bacterium]|nr:SIS domain-containing protein [Pseudomonadales bacterium]